MIDPKTKRTNLILFILAALAAVYTTAVYAILQTTLSPALDPLPEWLFNLGNTLAFSFLLIAIYHLYLLFRTLRSLPNTRNPFWYAAMLVGVILSGIFILADITQLGDIGKEYLYWDVSGAWFMLYGSMFGHLLFMVWGFLTVRSLPAAEETFFQQMRAGNDVLFQVLNNIGVFCGLLGFIGIAASNWATIPERFRSGAMLIFSLLAVLPWASLLAYWAIKNRKASLGKWLDEKQMVDTAKGALVSMAVVMPLLAVLTLVSVLSPGLSQMPYLLAALFFLQLLMFSVSVLRQE